MSLFCCDRRPHSATHYDAAVALPSNMPTPSSRLRRVKCSAMNGDDFVGKHRNRYGSPSRTSGLCDTFTFSPLTSSHSFVKSHNRSELSNEPAIERVKPNHLECVFRSSLTRCQNRSVPTEAQRMDRTAVAAELRNQMAVRQIPNQHSIVGRSGGQESAAHCECQRINRRLVAGHQPHIVAGQTVPQADGSIARSGRNVVGIRMEEDALDEHG